MAGEGTSVTTTGPLFDGGAERAMHAFIQAAVDEVAKAAISAVHQNLDASIRNPTPYYETQIVVDRMGTDRVVHDRGIVYGPWLEGTGSRNRTTRFKGYSSFRRARDRVQGQAASIVVPVLRRFLPRMT